MRVSTTNIPSFEEDNIPALNQTLTKFANAINNIEFGNATTNENIWCDIVTVTTSTANTEFVVAHALKRVPIGVWTIRQDKAGVIYDSGTVWTSTNIYLKCDVATVALTLLII